MNQLCFQITGRAASTRCRHRVVGLRPENDELRREYGNLSKPFGENPNSLVEAAEQHQKSLELALGSARDRLIYALALLGSGETDNGIAELELVQRQGPNLPHRSAYPYRRHKTLPHADHAH